MAHSDYKAYLNSLIEKYTAKLIKTLTDIDVKYSDYSFGNFL